MIDRQSTICIIWS